MRLTFYGAAGQVTGSKHLLEVENQKILLDCGTFQGLPDVRERNRSFAFAPESITQVILSHAHLDHAGMLPLLVKRHFSGSILATPATRDVAERMLADSIKIELQDAQWRQKHKIGAPDDREALVTLDDIAPTMARFVSVPYQRRTKQWYQISDTVALKFYDAGHILGSSITVLKLTSGGRDHYLAYTGDIGPPGLPLLHDPETPTEPIETIITETTYGGHTHGSLDTALQKLATVINQVVAAGGKIVVPAFALGRTQLLVYLLHKLTDTKQIPRLPIYVDSPLATDITEVFTAHQEDYDAETTRDFIGAAHPPLFFQNLRYIREAADSKALNSKSEPCIIVASSGMMTAGRVIHHLRHLIHDPRNAILITGYQAQGTLGRRILEGAKEVELHGEYFPVRAQIHVFNELSAHADREQLFTYLKGLPALKRVILVHGEDTQADEFKQFLNAEQPAWQVSRPSEGDIVEL